MKKRIFNNWKTSLIGLFLIIIALVFVWFDRATWSEFAAFIPFCFGLIYVKDTILKLNNNEDNS